MACRWLEEEELEDLSALSTKSTNLLGQCGKQSWNITGAVRVLKSIAAYNSK